MAITGIQMAERAETAYKEKWGYIWASAGEKWTTAKQTALEQKFYSDPAKYQDYGQAAKYGSKWVGHKVTDCSGLIKWAALQLGLKGIYHGSNSQFNKNCKATGKIQKGVSIPIGALIFTGNEVGKHNHVGILVNSTTVLEAKGTTAGVVHTALSNKKWTYWGLLKDVEYDLQIGDIETVSEVYTQPKGTRKTLRRGMKGDEVKLLQTLLAEDGSTLAIDGIFGIGTLSAVKSFQKRHKLTVDGIVGPKTWAELEKFL